MGNELEYVMKVRTPRQSIPEPAWSFPERLVSQGTKLLTQQCWYWGCDVRRATGNLLLAHGFQRTRPPTGVTGSTIYALTPTPDTQVLLWSFGVFYGQRDHGGVFLNRFRCAPLLTTTATLPPTIWQIDALPPLTRPSKPDQARLGILLPALFDWICRYERAILTVEGLAYREACVAQWSRQRLALPAAGFVAAWADLADVINTIIGATDG